MNFRFLKDLLKTRLATLTTGTDEPVLTDKLIDRYCHLIDTEGTGFWWTLDIKEGIFYFIPRTETEKNQRKRGKRIKGGKKGYQEPGGRVTVPDAPPPMVGDGPLVREERQGLVRDFNEFRVKI